MEPVEPAISTTRVGRTFISGKAAGMGSMESFVFMTHKGSDFGNLPFCNLILNFLRFHVSFPA